MKTWFPIALYGSIAVLNQLLTATVEPATSWDWFRLIAGAVAAGAIAVKAKISPPES
jgi:hypothetical protein